MTDSSPGHIDNDWRIDPTPYSLSGEELVLLESDLPASAEAPTREARAIAIEMADNVVNAFGDYMPEETRSLLQAHSLAPRVFSMPRHDFETFLYAWNGTSEESATHKVEANLAGALMPIGRFILLDSQEELWTAQTEEARLDWLEKNREALIRSGQQELANDSVELETIAEHQFWLMRADDHALEEIWHLAQDPTLPEAAMEVMVKYYKWKTLVERNPGKYHYGQSQSDQNCINFCQRLERTWHRSVVDDNDHWLPGEELLLRINFGTLDPQLNWLRDSLVRDLTEEAPKLFAVDEIYGHLGNAQSSETDL